jgi:hypothetical protein
MVTEEQNKYAVDMVAQKNCNVPVLMYDMQNLSSVNHDNADLRAWLVGMSADGYRAFIERLERM